MTKGQKDNNNINKQLNKLINKNNVYMLFLIRIGHKALNKIKIKQLNIN